MLKERICKKCGNLRSIKSFCIYKGKYRGWVCRNCRFEREKINEYEKEKELGAVATVKRRFRKYKYDAKYRGLTFNLSFSQFEEITNNKCYYCEGFSNGKQYCGIDRKDNNIGYILENCVSCCKDCNFIKSNMDYNVMIDYVIKISKIYNTLVKRGIINE